MKFPKLLLVIVVLVLSALGIVAQTKTVSPQQKTITKEDFEKIDKKASELLKTTPYRVTKTMEMFSEQFPKSEPWHKSVEEYIPPDRSHVLNEFNLVGKPIRDEWITIGKQKFHRKYTDLWQDPWKKVSQSNDPVEKFFIVINEHYFSLGTVLIDGKTVNVFLVQKKTKGKRGPKTPMDLMCDVKTTFWYERDGRLLKVLEEPECDGIGPTKDRGTEIYEYDPTIKIEAPAISEIKKTPTFDQWGVPNGRVMNPSNGVGSGGGQGSGQGRGSGIGTGTGNSGSNSPSPTQGLKIISKPRAQYTDAARSADIQGTVILRVTFLATGQIGSITAVKGLPNGLTEQAISAARRIQFEPARLNGEPVTVTKQIEFPFSLF